MSVTWRVATTHRESEILCRAAWQRAGGGRRHRVPASLAYNLNNEAELRSTLGDEGAAACAAVAMRRSLELGDLSGAADAAHAWVRSVPSLATAVRNWRRIVQIDVALGRSDLRQSLGRARARRRLGRVTESWRCGGADEGVQPRTRTRTLERRAPSRSLPGCWRTPGRGGRSPRVWVMLLRGLSRIARTGPPSELERAEICVERWRTSGASDDRGRCCRHYGRSSRSSHPLLSWLVPRARGRYPPAPPLLPPPVGIGRTRTTRAQLNAALTQLEEAALALSHRSDPGDLSPAESRILRVERI